MSLRTPGLSVEIAVSNMDLYPADLPGRASWGSNVEQLVPYLEKTGCRSFEIVQTEAIEQDIAGRAASGDTEVVGRAIGSVHQSFSNGEGFLGRISHWRGIPFSQASVAGMRSIAAVVGRPIPAVYYPDNLPGGTVYSGNAVHSVMQPMAEVYRDFEVWSNAELMRAMGRLGIVGLCPDTVHARRRAEDGTKPPSIAEVWANQFASGFVYQMHVGADRSDMAARDPSLAARSRKEFKAFTSRRWQDARNTEMGDMITAAIENWVPPIELSRTIGGPVLRQVIEIPPRPLAIAGRIKDHARFVQNLAEVVREAGATPLLWDTASKTV